MNNTTRSVLGRFEQLAEEARRDPALMDLKIISHGDQFTDWGAPMVQIDRAMHHLSESLPNRQLSRTRNAFYLLRAGVEELASYLRSQGVDV